MSDEDQQDNVDTQSEDEEESQWYFSRRGMLEGAGIAGGVVVGGAIGYDLAAYGIAEPEGGGRTPQLEEMEIEPAPSVEEAGADAFEFFSLDQALTVEALAARIFPSDELGPGAPEAGVVFYLDQRLNGGWGDGDKWYMQGPFHPETAIPEQGWQYGLVPKEVYNRGLMFLREYVTQKYGKPFAELSVERQKQVISALEKNKIPTFQTLDPKDFFDMLRFNVIEGMYSDPIYGGNRDMVGWRLKQYPGTPGSLGSYRARIESEQFIEIPPTALEGQMLGPSPRGGDPEPAAQNEDPEGEGRETDTATGNNSTTDTKTDTEQGE